MTTLICEKCGLRLNETKYCPSRKCGPMTTEGEMKIKKFESAMKHWVENEDRRLYETTYVRKFEKLLKN